MFTVRIMQNRNIQCVGRMERFFYVKAGDKYSYEGQYDKLATKYSYTAQSID
jgi:hypothetical protein